MNYVYKRIEPTPTREEICPDCGREVGGWKPMTGTFAPEWWASMRQRGIDPATGHRRDCRKAAPSYF